MPEGFRTRINRLSTYVAGCALLLGLVTATQLAGVAEGEEKVVSESKSQSTAFYVVWNLKATNSVPSGDEPQLDAWLESAGPLVTWNKPFRSQREAQIEAERYIEQGKTIAGRNDSGGSNQSQGQDYLIIEAHSFLELEGILDSIMLRKWHELAHQPKDGGTR